MRNQTSKIDELVNQKEALLFKKEKNQNRMHERNSAIETQIKKLENKTYRNKVATDAANADIDRQVNKINKLIELEKEYVNSIAGAQKPKTIKNKNFINGVINGNRKRKARTTVFR